MSTSAADTLEALVRPFADDPGIDHKGLAGLLVELARNVEPQFRAVPSDVPPVDPRLEQLRTVLLGREIEVLSRLSEVVESFPHYGGKGCEAIGVTPENVRQNIPNVIPEGFNSLPATLPAYN